MERYGMDSQEIENQLKSFGIDPSITGFSDIDLNSLSNENIENIRKSAGFYEKYVVFYCEVYTSNMGNILCTRIYHR